METQKYPPNACARGDFFIFLQPMKKVLKWLAVAILLPVLLVLLAAVLLYLPPVQNWAVR